MTINDPQRFIHETTQAIETRLIEIRRDIHAHPELAFEEVRTAGIVAAELTRLGIPHQTGIAKTGIVGLIEGGRPGPTLLIRADMDALPMPELTGLPWASTYENKMHACGHDLHTTTLIGVAEVLQKMAPQLAGRVKLMFQPAEETVGGADGMIDAGVLDNPKVDFALALHNQPSLPVGKFAYTYGPALAAADRFDIVVRGHGGHAAHPHVSVDPIVAAAHLVTQLQTVVSREVRPLYPAVVTVGMFSGGFIHNIIPDTVTIQGTVRTLHDEARQAAKAAIERLCAGLEGSMRARAELVYEFGVPAMVNERDITERTMASIRSQLGDDVAVEESPTMGAEDFSFVAERVPSFQLKVGAGTPGRNDKLHNSDYQPDERSIALGVEALSRAALDLLS